VAVCGYLPADQLPAESLRTLVIWKYTTGCPMAITSLFLGDGSGRPIPVTNWDVSED
jgi:hypothetical protein